MFAKFDKQLPKADHLFQLHSVETRSVSGSLDIGRVQFHVRTTCSVEGASVSATMRFQVGTQRLPGRFRSRYATPRGSLFRKASRDLPLKKSFSACRSKRKPSRA